MVGFPAGDVVQPLVQNPNRTFTADDEPSNELERLLSDSDEPLFRRLLLATWIELKLLFFLAVPAIAVYMITYIMTVATQIFAGHLGNLELAAASLGDTGLQIFTHGLLLGMASAVETLCGQAYGAPKISNARHIPSKINYTLDPSRDSSYTHLHLLQTHPYISWSSPKIASAASFFVYGLIPQIFGFAVNFPIQKFMQAQSIVAPSAYISLAALALHILLSWLAVYKIGLGLLGTSLVLSLSWWIISIAQFVYIITSENCKQTWTGFSLEAFSGLFSFFKLSASSAVMLCLEEWYFQILVLMTGLLPNPELSLDALAICFIIFTWIFMIFIGFNAAASVRVSNELGAGHPKAAKFSVVVVDIVAFIISVIAAVIIFALQDVISYVFTEGEDVAHAVADLIPLLSFSVVLNGIQPVLSGVAVGCGWQTFVAYVNIGSYYFVGLPAGTLLGFYFNLSVKGIWFGMLGDIVIQTIILMWVTFQTDWKKEVEKTLERLETWDDMETPVLED